MSSRLSRPSLSPKPVLGSEAICNDFCASRSTQARRAHVIAEEFGDWEGSQRRIDLLGIDKSGDLVVIELKRTEDGGHMELQALRYAAMVSTMTFKQAVSVFTTYLAGIGDGRNAHESLLEHLGWDEPRDDSFAQDVRIVLAAAGFHAEVTTAVLWLNEHWPALIERLVDAMIRFEAALRPHLDQLTLESE